MHGCCRTASDGGGDRRVALRVDAHRLGCRAENQGSQAAVARQQRQHDERSQPERRQHREMHLILGHASQHVVVDVTDEPRTAVRLPGAHAFHCARTPALPAQTTEQRFLVGIAMRGCCPRKRAVIGWKRQGCIVGHAWYRERHDVFQRVLIPDGAIERGTRPDEQPPRVSGHCPAPPSGAGRRRCPTDERRMWFAAHVEPSPGTHQHPPFCCIGGIQPAASRSARTKPSGSVQGAS